MTQSGHTMPSHTKTSGLGCRWHLITKPRDSSTEIVKQASAGSQHCVFELHHAAASSHDGCKHAAGLLQKALHKEFAVALVGWLTANEGRTASLCSSRTPAACHCFQTANSVFSFFWRCHVPQL